MANFFLTVLLILLGCYLNSAVAVSTTPDKDFIDNGNGTVTHKVTGLIWKRCAEGQAWSNNSCSGESSLYSYAQTTQLTSNFAGHSDWRVPNVAELESIVEYAAYQPAINAQIFPTTSVTQFWTSTVATDDVDWAWFIGFTIGVSQQDKVINNHPVRLVRGSLQSVDQTGRYTPRADFIDNGDGTLTHQKTGLIWQRCMAGQTWSGAGCLGIATHYTKSQAKVLTSNVAGQSDWHLPTIHELKSIVEYKNSNPAINSDLFPGSPAEYFWTSSAWAFDTLELWVVDFMYGFSTVESKVDGYDQGLKLNARLVRGGQSQLTDFYSNATYDADQQVVNIWDVQVADQHYRIQLKPQGNNLYALTSAKALAKQLHNQPGQYDLISQNLILPYVAVGLRGFKVTLKNIGDFVFRLDNVEEPDNAESSF